MTIPVKLILFLCLLDISECYNRGRRNTSALDAFSGASMFTLLRRCVASGDGEREGGEAAKSAARRPPAHLEWAGSVAAVGLVRFRSRLDRKLFIY